MDKGSINIVTVSDDNYSCHLGVMLCSLFENKSTEKVIKVYLIDVGISDSNINKLRKISNTYKFKLEISRFDSETFNNFETRSHISNAAYYKISIPDLYPNLEKVLFLDCDLIVKKDIEELWNINVESVYLAAVENPLFNRYDELFLPEGTITFNSGIMLINLAKWREDNISQKVTKFLEENSHKIRLHDQGGFNALMYKNWKEISPKCNQQSKFFELSYKQTTFTKEAFLTAKKDPSIIHYTTSSKPWHYLNTHPYESEYHKYREISPWGKVMFLDKNMKNSVIKFFLKVIPKRQYSKVRLLKSLVHYFAK